MIQVTAQRDGADYELTMTGHANYKPGNDIVCAAMSAITYTLLGTLDNLDVEYDSTERPGDLRLFLTSDDPRVKFAFSMVLIGFAQIAKAYPANVRLKFDGFFEDF